jgi:integrase
VDVPISTSTTLTTRNELFSTNEQLALAGFLAGYSGLTRDAYTLDLRQYVAWCTEHRLAVFGARRADIGDLGLERGHRTLTILRKGGKVVTIPLAPRTARAIDLAVGERCQGPIFVETNGSRIDRHAAGRIVRRVTRRAGIAKRVGPHTLRHAYITAALDAGVPLRDVQEAASTRCGWGVRRRRTDLMWGWVAVPLSSHAGGRT